MPDLIWENWGEKKELKDMKINEKIKWLEEMLQHMCSQRETPRIAIFCNHFCPGALTEIFKFGAVASRWWYEGCCWALFWDLKHMASFHFRTFLTNVFLNSSVQFSRSVVSDSLRPHELQHARPPCPSLTPGVHPDSCPLSWWCHPAISSSVVPFSSCPQSLSASESFPILLWC